MNTQELTSANAAGLVIDHVLGPGFYVGQILSQFVDYTFGNNTGIWFMPAAEAGFNDAALRLVDIIVTGPAGAGADLTLGTADDVLDCANATDSRTGSQPLLSELSNRTFYRHFPFDLRPAPSPSRSSTSVNTKP